MTGVLEIVVQRTAAAAAVVRVALVGFRQCF